MNLLRFDDADHPPALRDCLWLGEFYWSRCDPVYRAFGGAWPEQGVNIPAGFSWWFSGSPVRFARDSIGGC